MALLLCKVSKLFGIAGVIAVAANTFAYFRISRKKLAPFQSPIDESNEVLASFPIDKPEEDDGFFFAISISMEFMDSMNLKIDNNSHEDRQSDPYAEGQMKDIVNELQITNEKVEGENPNKGFDSERGVAQTSKIEEFQEPDGKEKEAKEKLLEDWELLQPDLMTEKEQMRRQVTNVFQLGNNDLEKEILGSFSRGDKLQEMTSDKNSEGRGLSYASSGEEKADIELLLAKGTNATVISMLIDWKTVMPKEPGQDCEGHINKEALECYRYTIEKICSQGLRVMVTLCKDSLPAWASAYGGWEEDKTIDYFVEYVRSVVHKLHDLVDFWVTFSEPHIVAFNECRRNSYLKPVCIAFVKFRRAYRSILSRMVVAHKSAYDLIHGMSDKRSRKSWVGISQYTSFVQPHGFLSTFAVEFTDQRTCFNYLDDVCNKLDFLGLNYYGQQMVSLCGPTLVKNEQYSEDGTIIYPDGLYRILLNFHDRYSSLNIPFIITANGVADATDHLRTSYLLEHLLAVRAAMSKGVSVKGYCLVSLTDNSLAGKQQIIKYGLVMAASGNSLDYICQPSYHIFSEISKTGKITRQQREKAWAELQEAVVQGKKHIIYYCLDVESAKCDEHKHVKSRLVNKDWRFGHYKPEGFQGPISTCVKCMLRVPNNVYRKKKLQ